MLKKGYGEISPMIIQQTLFMLVKFKYLNIKIIKEDLWVYGIPTI